MLLVQVQGIFEPLRAYRQGSGVVPENVPVWVFLDRLQGWVQVGRGQRITDARHERLNVDLYIRLFDMPGAPVIRVARACENFRRDVHGEGETADSLSAEVERLLAEFGPETDHLNFAKSVHRHLDKHGHDTCCGPFTFQRSGASLHHRLCQTLSPWDGNVVAVIRK